jgi:hypothetical protein
LGDQPAFRRVRVDDPRIIHLRALSRLEDDLQADLSRVTNRIREQVYRVAPTQTEFLAIVRVIENDVIYPRLMGHGVHLHPLAVIVAVLAGVELGGVAGVFLAIPVVAALSVAWRHGLGWLDEQQGVFRL